MARLIAAFLSVGLCSGLALGALSILEGCASVDTPESAPTSSAAPPVSPVAPVPSSDVDGGVATAAESPTLDVDGGQADAAGAIVEIPGETWIVGLPPGFREVDVAEDLAQNSMMQQTFAGGGTVLLQMSAVDGTSRRGVILVRGPTETTDSKVSAAGCESMAERMNKRTQATKTEPPTVIDVAAGTACRFAFEDQEGIAIRNLFLTRDGKTWGLQALHDAKEVETLAALDAVVSSWQILAEERARGEGFSVPVPHGFMLSEGEDFEKAKAAGAALLLANAPPPVSRGRRGYVWVQPITDVPGPWDRVSACERLSESILKSRPATATAERVDVVRFGFGPTCRIQIADTAEPLARIITIPAYAGRKVFVVTCNVDVRDGISREACQKIAAGLLADG